MSMGWDVVTLWHAEGGGRWLRSVFSGVRVEESSGDSPSEVGPTAEREMRVWFFGRTGVSRGDCVTSGARSEEEPPEFWSSGILTGNQTRSRDTTMSA